MPSARVQCQLIELPLPTAPPGPISKAPDSGDCATAMPERFGCAFLSASVDARARALELLLPYVGTMALLVIGKGHFARFAASSSHRPVRVVSPEAAEVDYGTIVDLVSYLEQREPQVPLRVLAQLEDDLPAPVREREIAALLLAGVAG